MSLSSILALSTGYAGIWSACSPVRAITDSSLMIAFGSDPLASRDRVGDNPIAGSDAVLAERCHVPVDVTGGEGGRSPASNGAVGARG